MAKLFFSTTPGIDIEPSGCVHATKTATDENYIHGKESLTVVEVSDSDYDNFFNGTSSIECNGNDVSFVANTIDETQEVEDEYKNDFYEFKATLEGKVAYKTNHSKIAEAQACLDYLNSVDVDNQTYPRTPLRKELKDNGVFVALNCF
tara:strand:+ start:1019 stop:1462 length:444 start_codon:yes stop_codon:yes gene_type:complete